ncbi:hypothetical protein Dda_8662 [Drechslerella dactyloides]|uniref:Uncharacterized protein n=1 Tax=Drechslerella dactyloides TaxID=74499 RepID=A0AAD6NG11_DREDA|nr:hypothetical protein Dda_8662 [Drechslerella dactyloides]
MPAPTPRRPPAPASKPKPADIPIPRTPGELPAKYRPAAIKVTLLIVALPVAIVSSYLVYKRLYLGEDRRRLVPPEDKADTIMPSTISGPPSHPRKS